MLVIYRFLEPDSNIAVSSSSYNFHGTSCEIYSQSTWADIQHRLAGEQGLNQGEMGYLFIGYLN